MEGFFQSLLSEHFIYSNSSIFIEKHNLLYLVLGTLAQVIMARETYQIPGRTDRPGSHENTPFFRCLVSYEV